MVPKPSPTVTRLTAQVAHLREQLDFLILKTDVVARKVMALEPLVDVLDEERRAMLKRPISTARKKSR